MNETEATFAGEVQFGGWRDSHRSGPSVTFYLSDSTDLEAFRGLTTRKGNQAGHRFMVALVEIGPDEKPVIHAKASEPIADAPANTGHAYGHHARALVQGGFFNPANTKVLEAIGTDANYQEWCRHQLSAIDGSGDLDERTGDLRCEPAHVRRAGEAGTGYKPLYATIPLTHVQHVTQHNRGQAACLDAYNWCGHAWAPNDADEWFDKARVKYVLSWAKTTLAKKFRVESIGDIEPAKLLAWATEKHLQHFLPSIYRSALTPEAV